MKRMLIAISASLAIAGAFAEKKPGNVLDLKNSISDEAIVYPESFEADTQKLLESWFIKNYTATDDRYATEGDVRVSDAVIIERLGRLPYVIDMPYNQIVRSYIEKYTQKRRNHVSALLGLGLYYNPIFEQALEEQGLPLELKYLPMIESSLDPNAVSKHGATGLWQFMLATAKGLGMEVNSLVDERRDPYLSSEMAASYLKGLYDSYGDWSLAIAAYNCGPGTVNKAIRRAGGDPKDHDFWSLYYYLPEETRGYVPAFIAINYVMNYYPEHNISPVLPTSPLVMDTIHVTDRIHFDQISNVLAIPVEELRILNPQYRADIIPGSAENPRNLILPSQQIHSFLMSEDEIVNYEADKYALRTVAQPGEGQDNVEDIVAVEEENIWAEPIAQSSSNSKKGGTQQTVIHKVKEGETLASIANTYDVSPEDIKDANNLRRNAVRVGQQLKITTSSSKAVNQASVAAVTPKATTPAKPAVQPAQKNSTTQKNTATNKNTSNTAQKGKQQAAKKPATPKQPTSHTIKNGENLTVIAKKYGVTVSELQNANGLKSDKIQIGKTLKIPSKKAAAKANTKNSNTTGKKKK